MKSPFWKADWFAVLVLLAVFLPFSASGPILGLERKAYDLGVLAVRHPASDKVAVIAIDDRSIAHLGRWPWSRGIDADLIDLLSKAGAKTIAYAELFGEPQNEPGLERIRRLIRFVDSSSLKSAASGPVRDDTAKLDQLLADDERNLDADRRLAESLGRAGNVLLGFPVNLGAAQGKPDRSLPAYLQNSELRIAQGSPPSASAAYFPIPELGSRAAAVGFLAAAPDAGGTVRAVPLAVRYSGHFLPSLSLLLAASSLNLKPADIRFRAGAGVSLGPLTIGTGSQCFLLRPYQYKGGSGKPAFAVDSFYDVLSGKISAAKYRGKIVLVGATAAGVGTAAAAGTPPVLSLARDVSSLLQRDFLVVPPWAAWAEKGALLAVALYLILLLPRLGAGVGTAFTASMLAALIGGYFVLMLTQGIWLQLLAPALLLLAGHALLTAKRFLRAKKGKRPSAADSVESNRMLGLAFQGQGQLDKAFDTLRQCPLDGAMLELLYNLALDFERKRQFKQAAAVFAHMAEYNSEFRDLKTRQARCQAMLASSPEDGSMLSGGGDGEGANNSLEVAAEPQMLGRYRLERELGKGAMGVVYLGRDPKIGREVAIKTLALAREFEGDELEEVKTRFFREAEAAGRLNHPNIVTIYDAGEERGLAYIAMELLMGKDLTPYTKPGNLLPLGRVLKIAAKVASALNYAHAQNIVHRDIKPANIMYEPEGTVIKVADFGIARLTDSSKTKTGMVLGTPSYMSPEQLAGKKVDGRSDLFSLGVMVYQLSSGQLPFQGESLTELMFRIANEAPRNIRAANPNLPECLVEMILKMLEKDPAQRYQTGEEIERAIGRCASQIASALGRKS
ncbi:MAG: CHASE2 domain-containing serine/threonine-protein kinase [Burkholderiales bacterium]